MRSAVPAIFFTCIFLLSNLPVLAQYVDDDIVVAQEWEGIYELLQRNELNPATHRQAFIALNAAKLGGDTLLIAGSAYELPKRIVEAAPPKVTKKPVSYTYPVFGKKYEHVPVIDNKLEGAV
jgi:hypothetical protein